MARRIVDLLGYAKCPLCYIFKINDKTMVWEQNGELLEGGQVLNAFTAISRDLLVLKDKEN